MKGFIAWMVATAAYGWLCGVLGPHPDSVRCGLALAAWLAAWGGAFLYRDLSSLDKGQAHRPDGRGASNISDF